MEHRVLAEGVSAASLHNILFLRYFGLCIEVYPTTYPQGDIPSPTRC
jgi:hypothetical protein